MKNTSCNFGSNGYGHALVYEIPRPYFLGLDQCLNCPDAHWFIGPTFEAPVQSSSNRFKFSYLTQVTTWSSGDFPRWEYCTQGSKPPPRVLFLHNILWTPRPSPTDRSLLHLAGLQRFFRTKPLCFTEKALVHPAFRRSLHWWFFFLDLTSETAGSWFFPIKPAVWSAPNNYALRHFITIYYGSTAGMKTKEVVATQVRRKNNHLN